MTRNSDVNCNMGFYSILSHANRCRMNSSKMIDNLDEIARQRKRGKLFTCFLHIALLISPFYIDCPGCLQAENGFASEQRRLRKQTRRKLSNEKDQLVKLKNKQINGYALRFHVPFKRSGSSSKPCPIRAYVINFSLLCVCLQMFIVTITYILFEHEMSTLKSNLIDLYPLTMPTTTTRNIERSKNFDKSNNGHIMDVNWTNIENSPRCFMIQDLDADNLQRFERIERLTNLLISLGSPVITINDLLAFSLVFLTSLSLVTIIFAWLNWENADFRVDSLTIHFEPTIERDRLLERSHDLRLAVLNSNEFERQQNELLYANFVKSSRKKFLEKGFKIPNINQFCGLLSWYKNSINNNNNFYYQHQKNNSSFSERRKPQFPYTTDERTLLLRNATSKVMQNFGDTNIGLISQREISKEISMKLSDDEKSLGSVFFEGNRKIVLQCNIPAHLSKEGYERILSQEFRDTICVLIFNVTLGIAMIFGLLYRELESRASHRLQQRKCDFWLPGSLSLDWPAKMPQIDENNDSDNNNNKISKYPDNSNGFQSIMTEFLVLLTKESLLFSTELVYCFVTLVFWCGSYVVFVVSSRLIINLWAANICKELKLIGSMMENFLQQKIISERSGSQINFAGRNEIERNLTQCYLDFMLFRRELRFHQAYFKFIVSQTMIDVAYGTIICLYTLSNSGDRNREIIWATTIFIILLFNTFAHLGVTFTNKMHRLFSQLNKIMASSARLSMESSYIVSLWRRQVMSSDDTELNFGLRILGIECTHATLIQLNSYVLAASLYLFKPYIKLHVFKTS